MVAFPLWINTSFSHRIFSKIFFWRKKNTKKDKEDGKEISKKEESRLDVNLIPTELTKSPETELPAKIFNSGMVVLVFIVGIPPGRNIGLNIDVHADDVPVIQCV